MTKSTRFLFVSALALLVAALSCREAAAPPARRDPGSPRFVVFGPQPAIQGTGALGTGPAAAGGDRQEFDFNVQQDLTGRVFYKDWRYSATIKVDPADPATAITAFRNQSTRCPGNDPTLGAELDGTGRREDLRLESFTLVACDLGPAESGADWLRMTTTAGYAQAAFLTSGDIVKTVVQSTGDLDVTTSTSGSSLPTGYTVSVDGNPSQPIGINAKVTFTALAVGSHTVVLSGVPSNCTVTDGATRTATVTSGQTATVAYSVSCVTPTGNLDVTTSTSGSSLPNGYTVSVDGNPSQAIGINAKQSFTALTEGSHTVVLSGVPSNCTLSGSATQTATVTSGQTATVAYSVSCVTPTGNLDVTTSTSGSSLPAGYTVSVDGNPSQAIGINATQTFTALAAGSHTVVLSGVPANCTLSGSATQTATVPSAQTATVSYSVSCITPNRAPVVQAGNDERVLLALSYQLRWSFTDPDNGPWRYTINWGDGSSSSGPVSAAGSHSTTHHYLGIGSYTIRVTVTDGLGASGSDTKQLTLLLGLGGLL